MQPRILTLALLGALAVPAPSAHAQSLPCSGGELATVQPFASTNNGPVGGGLFFDMTVTKPGGVRMLQLETNIASPAGTSFTMMVWARPGSHVGNESSNSGWFIATTGSGVSAGPNQPTLVDVTDVLVSTASWGVCLQLFGAGHAYTVGNGTNQSYANAELSLSLGAASNSLFGGALPSPFVWNGKLFYECLPPVPQSYCGAGLSTNQCTPLIRGSHEPSASFANPCFINVDNLEGQKQGLIFYGIDNSGFSPSQWGSGSSFLCVKAPVQRTGVQNSGGTLDQCDGSFFLDWNAYQAANPSALGQPFAAGHKAYVQAWYRDPPASKSTNLSDAIEMTMLP